MPQPDIAYNIVTVESGHEHFQLTFNGKCVISLSICPNNFGGIV